MQRWFVSSLSEIVIVVLDKVRQKNEMFYSLLEHVILHVHSIFAIAHLPPEVILQDQAKIRTLNFQGHSKYYIHNIFKTLAYSSNLTQNGSCIRNLPSLTLKTPPPFSMNFSLYPQPLLKLLEKNYTLNPRHQISSAPDKSHPQSYEIPPYADHSFFHYMRISITHAPKVYVV